MEDVQLIIDGRVVYPTPVNVTFTATLASNGGHDKKARRVTLRKSDIPAGAPDQFMALIRGHNSRRSFGGTFVKNHHGRYYLHDVAMPDCFRYGDPVHVTVVEG